MGDDPANDRSLPVIIAANQSARAIVQFQCRILQWIGNTILAQLRTNGAYDHSLWCGSLHNETANHHVVVRLHKAASADVTKDTSTGGKVVHFHQRNSSRVTYTSNDSGVVTRWQVRNDRRFPPVSRSVAAVLNLLDLVVCDNS